MTNGPGKFYKGRSQEKTHLLRLEFFLLLSPLDQASSVLTFRAMCTVAGPCDPVVLVFSTSGFHRFLATKPVSSETGKAERRSKFGDHSSIWDSWPIAFSGYPRGPRVVWRLGARGTQRLTNQLRLALELRVSREPDGHRQRRSPGWSGLDQRHSSCLWFQILGVEAHSSLPHHQHDGGNLPGQSQPCHFRLDALGQQSGVELLQRTGFARSHDRRALKHILQIVIAISVQSTNGDLFLSSLQLPVDTTVIGAAV